LDPLNEKRGVVYIKKKISSEKKMSILLASHNMDEVKRLCKSILMMKDGKIIDRGTPSEIINKHGKKT
jgi:ABC-2 type transport system ATP-binding protein